MLAAGFGKLALGCLIQLFLSEVAHVYISVSCSSQARASCLHRVRTCLVIEHPYLLPVVGLVHLCLCFTYVVTDISITCVCIPFSGVWPIECDGRNALTYVIPSILHILIHSFFS